MSLKGCQDFFYLLIRNIGYLLPSGPGKCHDAWECRLAVAALQAHRLTYTGSRSRLLLLVLVRGRHGFLDLSFHRNMGNCAHSYRVGQKWGHKIMAMILSNLNRFTIFTGRFLGKFAVNWLVKVPLLLGCHHHHHHRQNGCRPQRPLYPRHDFNIWRY